MTREDELEERLDALAGSARGVIEVLASGTQPRCGICEERPASCVGAGGGPVEILFACDECCGHGNEDGWCAALASPYDDYKKREVPLAASRNCWICGWDEPHTHTPEQINDAATKGPFCWGCQGQGVIHTHPPTVGSCLPGCRKCVACASTGQRPPRASALSAPAAPKEEA